VRLHSGDVKTIDLTENPKRRFPDLKWLVEAVADGGNVPVALALGGRMDCIQHV
jgi:hypothetical protein